MNIYVSHRRKSDFQNNLYQPLKNSDLAKTYNFILPHDDNPNVSFNVKDILQNKRCDLVLAEVSEPATGQGIELGWANILEIPIICIYKKGSDISGSLKFICNEFIEYENADDMIEKLGTVLKNF